MHVVPPHKHLHILLKQLAGLVDFDVSDEWPDGDDDLMALSGVDCV